jgi:hypothetical protein
MRHLSSMGGTLAFRNGHLNYNAPQTKICSTNHKKSKFLPSSSFTNILLRMSVKEQVLRAIQRLPDDIEYRDVAEELALLMAVNEAEVDIEKGRLVTNEQMQARIREWTGS